MSARTAIAFATAVIAAAVGGCSDSTAIPRLGPGDADAARAPAAMRLHGCTVCHAIPGVRGIHAPIGPPLTHFARQSYVAGVLPNLPGPLVAFIRDPQSVDPRSAMPALGVSEQEARDIAAYLYADGAQR